MFEFKDKNVTIKVYNYFSHTKEYIGDSDCFIVAGTGLPGNCTDIQVPDEYLNIDGFKAVFDITTDNWILIEDHRGEVVYDIHTKQSLIISSLGALSERVTKEEPREFDKWDGEKWIEDIDAKKEFIQEQSQVKKITLLTEANEKIAILQDIVDFDMQESNEDEQLKLWK